MRKARIAVIPAALLLLVSCYDRSGKEDKVTWTARFTAGESSGTGGAVIQASGSALAVPSFLLGEPVSHAKELPPPDLASVGAALLALPPDAELRDACRAADSHLVLYREPEGEVVVGLLAELPGGGVPVPEGACRVVTTSEAPLRILVILTDGRAIPGLSLHE